MASKAQIQREIRDYCSLNGIEDVDGFIWKCTVQGFSVIRYGTSPVDNVRRESEIPRRKRTSVKAEEKPVENEVKVTKRKIKVIDNG